jgi:hypothetical protein
VRHMPIRSAGQALKMFHSAILHTAGEHIQGFFLTCVLVTMKYCRFDVAERTAWSLVLPTGEMCSAFGSERISGRRNGSNTKDPLQHYFD